MIAGDAAKKKKQGDGQRKGILLKHRKVKPSAGRLPDRSEKK